MKSFAIILLLFSLFAFANENESEQVQDQAEVEQHRQEYQEQLDELEKKFPINGLDFPNNPTKKDISFTFDL